MDDHPEAPSYPWCPICHTTTMHPADVPCPLAGTGPTCLLCDRPAIDSYLLCAEHAADR